MFKKILIVEDIDTISIGLSVVIGKMYSAEIVHAKYCDDAILKLKKANFDAMPFDLLITDLSFPSDHRDQKIINGEGLIKTIKAENYSLKIIVHSIEDRAFKIKYLLHDLDIDSFVWKGRDGSSEIIQAISFVFNKDKKYISPQFLHLLNPVAVLQIDQTDLYIIKLLSLGNSQIDISTIFTTENRTGSSVSNIEKRINKLKIYFKAKNVIHLVSIVKDLGMV